MSVNSNPPGVLFGRFVRCLAVAKGDLLAAEAYAAGQGLWRSTPEVERALKSLVGPVEMGGMESALQPIGRDLAAYLRPRTVLGRLQGTQRVPFKVRLLSQTSGASAAWTQEGEPLPVTKLDITDRGVQLEPLKLGCIGVITSELARHSGPMADTLVAADATAGIIEATDRQLIDPAAGGIADVSPASLTHGATSFESRGQTVAAIDSDLKDMLGTLTGAELNLQTAAWVMHPTSATHLASMRGAGSDSLAYPGMTARGGTLMGLPVLTSTACTASGSPGERFIALIEASEVLVADDGDATIDISDRVALQMNDAPSTGAQQLVSLWQAGLMGVRVRRYVNWKTRRSAAVAVLRSVGF